MFSQENIMRGASNVTILVGVNKEWISAKPLAVHQENCWGLLHLVGIMGNARDEVRGDEEKSGPQRI